MQRKQAVIVWIVLIVIVGILAACASAATKETESATPAAADGETLLKERCTPCHHMSKVTAVAKSRAEWEETIGRMVNKGAELSPEEYSTLLDYLAETYGR